MAVGHDIAMNLTYPKSPDPRVPTLMMREIDDANVPIYMTGILLPHVVCTLFIFARIASRLCVIRKWHMDDTLIFLSWLFSTALCIVYSITATTPSLLAAPREASLQRDSNPYIMRTYLGLIYYQMCLCITKFSILAFYLRVFASRPRERLMAWGTVVVVLLYGVPMLLMSFLQCHPVMGQFFDKPMVCFGFPELLISSASLHSATDAWLIVMVIPCVTRLDLPWKQKVALAVVLSLSVFVIAASMVRLQLSLHLHYQPSSARITNTLAFFVMTILECDLALICASAPTLRPLLAKVFPRLMSASKRRSLEAVETESFDLTSLTYHGYPWTEPTTPFARSRNASYASHLNKLRKPAPPVPVLSMSQRAPATLSLRSAVLAVAPRSRGQLFTGDGRPILNETWGDRRPCSSVYSTDPPMAEVMEQRAARNDGVVLKEMKLSLGPGIGGRDGSMDEEKKPLSPNEMPPKSILSGNTYAASWSIGKTKYGMKYAKGGRLMTEMPQRRETQNRVPPRRPRRPDDPLY